MPIFPNDGKRLTAQMDVAGLGGNTQYLQFRSEGIWYIPITPTRPKFGMSLGLRAEAQYIRPYGDDARRSRSSRSCSSAANTPSAASTSARSRPRDPNSGLLTGGNKTMVFNAEYYINIVGPVRFLFFYDAGQVRDIGEAFTWSDQIIEVIPAPLPPLFDPFVPPDLITPPGTPTGPTTRVIGKGSSFRPRRARSCASSCPC